MNYRNATARLFAPVWACLSGLTANPYFQVHRVIPFLPVHAQTIDILPVYLPPDISGIKIVNSIEEMLTHTPKRGVR